MGLDKHYILGLTEEQRDKLYALLKHTFDHDGRDIQCFKNIELNLCKAPNINEYNVA